jgi:tetratricopeptide (TPR) repeat protein
MEELVRIKPVEGFAGHGKCSCSLAGTRVCDICPENPKKSALKIRSSRSSELSADIVLDGIKYHVQTARLGPKNPVIVTNAWRAGEVVFTRKTDYRSLPGLPGRDGRLQELMQEEHRLALQELTRKTPPGKVKDATVYLEEVRCLVKSRNYKEALKILDEALIGHPFNPFLLSYHGWMIAVVCRDYDRGTDICKDALDLLKADEPAGFESFSPFFHLNLGRAYSAAGDKRNAVQAWMKGLDADPNNSDLLAEISGIGKRRKPMIPFLKRSNAVNKFAGKVLHKRAVAKRRRFSFHRHTF